MQLLGEFTQNARDLRGFLLRQLNQLIVRFDRFKRLHENGLPGRARAVRHALHTAAVFRAHRDHEPFVAQRDVIFSGFRIARAQNLFERFLDGLARLGDARADPP